METEGVSLITKLEAAIRGGKKGSLEAFNELSLIALGGSTEARKIVDKLDSEKLSLRGIAQGKGQLGLLPPDRDPGDFLLDF